MADDFEQLAGKPYPVALVIYPLIESLEDYPFTSIHQQVRELARAAGLPVLDVLPRLADYPTEALQVHSSDHHPNGQAAQVAADAIAAWLKSDLPDYLQGSHGLDRRAPHAGDAADQVD